jgi:putative Holliday junction resolvase
MARIIALDIGLKRTGLAVTDNNQIIATALDTVDTTQLFEYLKSYFIKEKVELLVVGLPKDLRNEDTHATKFAIQCIEKLNKLFPEIQVKTVDERFTSKIAMQTLILSGKNKKYRAQKSNIDKVSATIILQSYMESSSKF